MRNHNAAALYTFFERLVQTRCKRRPTKPRLPPTSSQSRHTARYGAWANMDRLLQVRPTCALRGACSHDRRAYDHWPCRSSCCAVLESSTGAFARRKAPGASALTVCMAREADLPFIHSHGVSHVSELAQSYVTEQSPS